jgi:YVTN family beta-propeller protein
MSVKVRSFVYFTFVTFCVVIPAHASVAYIVNCCNHDSTVSVFSTATGRQTALWKVGEVASAAVFSPDGSTAYVANEDSQSVTVINVATGMTTATVATGHPLRWMIISQDGSKLYAESYHGGYENYIVAIATATNTVSAALGVGVLGPMAISPDGKTLYVASDSYQDSAGVLVINTATMTVTTTVSTDAANGLSLTPDGKFVYANSFGSSSGPYSPNVTVIDTSTNTITTTIPLDPKLTPGYIQISPDGSVAWVSEFPYTKDESLIAVIQTSTNQVTGSFRLPGGASPGSIVFSPDSTLAYVDIGSAVDVVDVATTKTTSEIESLGAVFTPAISPDGNTLLLPNSGQSRVAAYSQSTETKLASIAVGDMDLGTQLYLEYGGAAVSPDGSRLYVTNYYSNNITIIATKSKKAVTSVEVESQPLGVAVPPDGSKAYVANSYSNSVTVVNTNTFATTNIAMPKYSYPSAIAISPDGTHVYVAGDNVIPDFGTARCYIFVIDTSSNQVVDSIRVPYPSAVAVSPDGANIYVVGGLTYLYTISAATDTITNSLLLENGGPEQPYTSGLAVTPDGTKVFADSGGDKNIFEVDVTQNKVINTIKTGEYAGVLAVTPDGTQVWAGDYLKTYVSVIDVQTATVTNTIPLGNQTYAVAFGPQ